MAKTGMLQSRTRLAATSSCVDNGFEGHSATSAPPSRSAIIKFAVSAVTCRQAETRMPLSGWFLMNSLRMICSTFIDWFAHSMRFLPRSASSNPFTSLLIDVVAIFSPDERAEVRGQIAEVTPDPNSFLLRSQFLFVVVFVARAFTSDLEPLTLFSCSNGLIFFKASVRGQFRCLVGPFPGEIWVAAAEVPVGRGLAIDRTAQVERLDDLARLQLEVCPHQARNQMGINLLGSEGIPQYADGVSHSDRVRELHFAAIRQSGSHDVLGDVARHVRSRAIDLRRILAAERAAAVASHAAVRVHDDLASGQTGIAHGSADHKTPGGIDVVLGVFVE